MMSDNLKIINKTNPKQYPKEREIVTGDRFQTPDGNEFVIRWDKVRKAIEIVKTDSRDNDTTINISPGVSNIIYIK